MKRMAFITGIGVGLIMAAGIGPLVGVEQYRDVAGFNRRTALQELKLSAAWTAMQTQLDQYDAHYIAATNAITQVTDSKTQTALLKSIKATDDCHDAVLKLIQCFKQYVAAQGD